MTITIFAAILLWQFSQWLCLHTASDHTLLPLFLMLLEVVMIALAALSVCVSPATHRPCPPTHTQRVPH